MGEEMLDGNQVSEQIRNFILDRFPLARKHNFDYKTPLLETGLLDSLGILDVVEFVEQKIGIPMSDDDLVPDNFQTVEHISAFLVRKQSNRSSSQA
jgi:acyl carrier protein